MSGSPDTPTEPRPVATHHTHIHDFHATILHLLGFDHEQRTHSYIGRDFRLTGLAGNVLDVC